MSKVLVWFEDTPQGLQWGCAPSAEELVKKQNSGNPLTTAEFYAVVCLNHMKSKSNEIRRAQHQATQLELARPDFVEHVHHTRNIQEAKQNEGDA